MANLILSYGPCIKMKNSKELMIHHDGTCICYMHNDVFGEPPNSQKIKTSKKIILIYTTLCACPLIEMHKKYGKTGEKVTIKEADIEMSWHSNTHFTIHKNEMNCILTCNHDF